MDEIREFVDERQKSWCIHCAQGTGALEMTRDHVPSKSLLSTPYPANLPIVRICKTCNEGFSLDEQYLAAFLGCVLAGSTEPDRQHSPKVERILRDNLALRARIEGAKSENRIREGDTRCVWMPEVERINRVIVKNARGHAFFEYGEPKLEEPHHVSWAPLSELTTEQREHFERIDMSTAWLPEVGSRMLTRVFTGQDIWNGWVIVQDGIYRYAVVQQADMVVRSVLAEYLATEVRWRE